MTGAEMRAWWRASPRALESVWDGRSEFARDLAHDEAEVDRLRETIPEKAAQIDAAKADLARDVARFDELVGWSGFNSMTHWLGWRIGLTSWDAREMVRVAGALEELPATREALAKGELSWSKVRRMTKAAGSVDEDLFVHLAKCTTGPMFAKLCRGVRTVQAAREAEEAREAGEEPEVEEWVRFWTRDDRHTRVSGQLGNERAALLKKALQAMRRDVYRGATEDDETIADEGFTVPDALVGLAESYLERAGAPAQVPGQYEVGVHAVGRMVEDGGIETDLGFGWLEDGTILPSEILRMLACDGPVVEMVEGPDGTPMDVGRRTRTIPVALRRALLRRDGGRCRFPGCPNGLFTDGHHIVHWADGGPTELDNLVLLCRTHHRLAHEEVIRVEMVDGRPVFHDAEGRLIPDVPPPAALEGDALAALRERNRAAGHEITPETNISTYTSDYRMDYHVAIEEIFRRRGPPP